MRDSIMIDWFKKGESAKNNDNPFDAFIYLWISWMIGCKIYISYNYNKNENNGTTDREDLIIWCKQNSSTISQIIEENYSSLCVLGKRKGEATQTPIIDTTNRTLIQRFNSLSKFFKNEYSYKNDKDLATDFGELLNKIRNNLFHGDKSYNHKKDLELINAVLPTLYEFAKEGVEYSKDL